METLLLEILALLRSGNELDERQLERLIRRHNSLQTQVAQAHEQAQVAQAHRKVAQKAAGGQKAHGQAAQVAQAHEQKAGDGKLSNVSGQARFPVRPLAKKRLLPYYLRMRQSQPERWAHWQVDEALEARLVRLLQVKPRRTASGVATITVLTRPWPCSSNCLYCPSDLRMPKSYLHSEPACQRAERNYFDPYLQVATRLRALAQMGHPVNKIELIVLGGTWCEYPEPYQVWFISELFRALNNGIPFYRAAPPNTTPLPNAAPPNTTPPLDAAPPNTTPPLDAAPPNTTPPLDAAQPDTASSKELRARRTWYRRAGLTWREQKLSNWVGPAQQAVDAGECTYNQAFHQLYGSSAAWQQVSCLQQATIDELMAQQQANETAAHRVVGLSLETRPETLTAKQLLLMRVLGCTKVQIGVQTLHNTTLALCQRQRKPGAVERAFELLRLFGYKVHVHFMANLPGTTPATDADDYRQLVSKPAYLPDEVKLYPCALIAGTQLVSWFEGGRWRPYSQEELVSLLVGALHITPAYTRVSRMIRDFSAQDIVVGNKQANLRQVVEERLAASSIPTQEIRYREIALCDIAPEQLSLQTLSYHTTVTLEYFLQWVTPTGGIAGFLRLSLPKESSIRALKEELASEGGPAGDLMNESEAGLASGRASERADRNTLASGRASGNGLANIGELANKLPLDSKVAMIREVHVYGKAARLTTSDTSRHAPAENAQHHGLGRTLIEEACVLAANAGLVAINVISAVGTRAYYQSLGFEDTGLYQQRRLDGKPAGQ